jgi:hypothetical protein
MRAIIRDSFELRTYEPAGKADWIQAYARFRGILAA